ncbi:MAG TPA: lysophospholipid acyltransferase family protein [Chthoniobacterales bacterium]
MDAWKYKPAAGQNLPPGDSMRSVQREAGLVSTITQACWRTIVRLYLGGYHRLRVEGRENLPLKPPFVMIANHSSHLDALTLASALPWRLRRYAFPIAAGDIFFQTPVSTWFSAMMLNALPMWRKRCGSHAMQELRDRLIGEPTIYILFPEGTRTRDGKMGPFKPGLGMIVSGSNAPVIPCYLDGAFSALPPGKKWPRPATLRLRIGPPLTFADVENRREGWQKIGDQLTSAVEVLRPETPS